MNPERANPSPDEPRQGTFDYEAGKPDLPTKEEEWQANIRAGIEAGREEARRRTQERERQQRRLINNPDARRGPSEARRDETSESIGYVPTSSQEALRNIRAMQADQARRRQQSESDNDPRTTSDQADSENEPPTTS